MQANPTTTNRHVTAPTTGYQTLISVNSIDPDKFKTSDRAAASKHWYNVFVQNSVSEEIYDAITSKNSTEKEEKAQRELASSCYLNCIFISLVLDETLTTFSL